MSSGKKKIVISHVISYSSAQYVSQGIGIIIATCMRRFLGPYYAGVWDLLRLVLEYAGYLHLGAYSVIDYKLPYLKGKGDTTQRKQIKNVVFSFSLVMSVIAFFSVLLYAFFFRTHLKQEIFFGFIAVSVIIVAQRLYTFFVCLLRADKNFKVLNQSVVLNSLVHLIMLFVLVKHFKIYGLYCVLIFMPIFNLIFILFRTDYHIRFSFYFRNLFSYIQFGFPVFAVGILSSILYSIDRIMISRYIGLEALGVYALGLMARNYGSGIMKNFTIVLLPHFMEDYGKNENAETISKYLKQPVFIMAFFMILLLGSIFIVVPLFVNILLPKFTAGIHAMQILLVATFFYSLYPSFSNYLIVKEKKRILLGVIGTMIVFNLLCNYFFITLGFGIEGVAVATTLSSFFIFIIYSVCALSFIDSIVDIFCYLMRILIPFIYAIMILFFLEVVPIYGTIYIQTLIRFIFYITLLCPLYYYLNKKTGILSLLFSLLLQRLRKK